MPGLTLACLVAGHHAGNALGEGVGTIGHIRLDPRQIVGATQSQLVAVPLRLQLRGNPFARVDLYPAVFWRQILVVGNGDDLVRVMVRLSGQITCREVAISRAKSSTRHPSNTWFPESSPVTPDRAR